MTKLIDSLRRGVPAGLEDIAEPGRTLAGRHAGIVAVFEHHAPNGLVEAINGCLEALHRSTPGFRHLDPLPNRSLLRNGALH